MVYLIAAICAPVHKTTTQLSYTTRMIGRHCEQLRVREEKRRETDRPGSAQRHLPASSGISLSMEAHSHVHMHSVESLLNFAVVSGSRPQPRNAFTRVRCARTVWAFHRAHGGCAIIWPFVSRHCHYKSFQ